MSARKTNPLEFVGRPVWAEISLSALEQNLEAIRRHINPPTEKRQVPRQVLAIVKGNGYGHGGPEIAKALEKFGAEWFGVASAGEGMELRGAGVRKPILVLGGFWPGEEENLLSHRLTPAIHRLEQLLSFQAAAARMGKRSVFVHLKIDTGMNRLGIDPAEVDGFVRQLAACPRLELGGVFTHLASSEVFTDSPTGRQTAEQVQRFFRAIDRLTHLGVSPGLLHLANSAAVAARPETWADMVRPGAVLYGYHPGFDPPDRLAEFEAKLRLRPVMSLRSRLLTIRSVASGEGVGYNKKWIAPRPSRIAVLAAGYGDGIHRSLGNRGSVVIRGHRAPIIGIVSMDVTMLDVTEVPDAAMGDIATIYGTEGDVVYPANVVARSISTVTSDLISGVSRRVPRFYVP